MADVDLMGLILHCRDSMIFTLLIPLILRDNSAWSIHLNCTSLDCGRKPEHPEEAPAHMGRMRKLHTDSDPRQELNPGPWRCEAAVLTTVPPIMLGGSDQEACEEV